MNANDLKHILKFTNPYYLVYIDFWGTLVAPYDILHDKVENRIEFLCERGRSFGYDLRVRHVFDCFKEKYENNWAIVCSYKNYEYIIYHVHVDAFLKMVVMQIAFE